MRIAFLTTEYPTERMFAGGLASYLRRIAYSLLEEGHSVEVFCLSHTTEQIDDKGVTVHRIKENNTLINKINKTPYLWRFSGYSETLIPAFQLTSALLSIHKKQPFDIIQASNYRACGFFSALYKSIPIVTRISSYEPLWRKGYNKKLTDAQRQIEKLEMLQIRKSTACYAPSQLLSKTLKEIENITIATIEPPFFPPTINDEPNTNLSETANSDYAMFFGSIGRLKGCDRLLNIMPALLERIPDLHFIFAGNIKDLDGRPFDDLIKEACGKNASRVRIFSALRPDQLFPLVKRAKVITLPSRIDNLPNACLEAMSFGRVVIGTYDASFDQLIVDGENGFLVNQTDDKMLADCIFYAWNLSDQERQKMGENAKRTLERMTPRLATKRLADFFQTVLVNR